MPSGAYEQNLQCHSIPANADLSTKQHLFVNVNSSGKLVVAGDGGQAIGVLQDKPNAADQQGTVGISGVSMVIAGGTVTAGGIVASDASGRAVDVVSGDMGLGKALTGTTVSGDLISVLLMPQLGKVW